MPVSIIPEYSAQLGNVELLQFGQKKVLYSSLFVNGVTKCNWSLFLPMKPCIGQLGSEGIHDFKVIIAVGSPPQDGVVRQEVL